MKKVLPIILVLVIVCGIAIYFISRGGTENVINNSESGEGFGSGELLESGEQATSGDLNVQTKTITEDIKNEDGVALLNIQYEYLEFDTEDTYLKSLNEEIKNRADERVTNFKSFEEFARESVGTDLADQLPYTYTNKSQVSYHKDNILVVEDSYNAQSGGPHPTHGTEYHNYDIVQEKELTINDLFTDKTNSEIATIIMEKVNVDYKDYEEEIASFFEMLPLENNLNLVNFAIRENDILIDLQNFVPYAFGECTVRLEK